METYQKTIMNEGKNRITQRVIGENSSSNAVSEQLKKFDTNYSSDKIRNLFAEFDNITINEEDIRSNTLVKTNAISVSKLSFKARLYFTSAVISIFILLFLAIYNIFVINNMNSNIQLLQNNIVTESEIFTQLQENLSSLTDEGIINSELYAKGYSELSDVDILSVRLGDTITVEELQATTNWFDAICNFISKVFGG